MAPQNDVKTAIQEIKVWIRHRQYRIESMAKLRSILGLGEPFDLSWEKRFIDGTEYLKDLLNDAKTQIRQNERPKV